MSKRRTCIDRDCPDPFCVSSCPECGGLTRHADDCPNKPPSKEEAACCLSKRDDLGRFPIGYCGPDCERRPR